MDTNNGAPGATPNPSQGSSGGDNLTPLERSLGESGRVDTNDFMGDPRDRAPDPQDQGNDGKEGEELHLGEEGEEQGGDEPFDDDQYAIIEQMMQGMQNGPVVRPPNNWSAEETQLFAALPPKLQEVVAAKAQDMQRHFTQRMQEVAQLQQHYQGVDRQIQPRLQQWAMAGLTAETGLSQLLALSDFATSKPADFLRYFAQQRGIDLASLSDGESGQEPQYVDPHVAQAQQRIAALENHIAQMTQGFQQQQQAQQQAQTMAAVNHVNSQVEDFARATDESGAPLYPHWDSVESLMADYITSGHAQDLNQAYEMATWAVPEIRQHMLQQQQASVVQQLRRDAVRASRAAAPNATTRRGSETGDVSIRGQLERMM